VRAVRQDQAGVALGVNAPMRPLPRPLRVATRFLSRLVSGGVQFPRYAASLSAAAFLATTGVYGVWQGGLMPSLVAETANRAGFSVDAIRITGHQRTTHAEVLAALGFEEKPSIVTLDVESARARLLQLPWVASASVAKALPGSVSVEIVEKRAGAIWQNGGDIVALDEAGTPIGPARLAADRILPAFVGDGADKTGLAFADEIRTIAPAIADHVKVHIRISDRRWDLLLDNGMTVKLPETETRTALETLATLETEANLLARDVTVVDLRIPARTSVTLGETALAALFPLKDGEKPKGALQ
jgi:cell division protein FtsQ